MSDRAKSETTAEVEQDWSCERMAEYLQRPSVINHLLRGGPGDPRRGSGGGGGMNPTLRERIRWWRWFLTMPSRLDRWYHAHDYDKTSYEIMKERHSAKEPWPRIRQNRWIFDRLTYDDRMGYHSSSSRWNIEMTDDTNKTTEWQPIETAPKDSDIYILACRAGSKIPAVLGWDEDDGWYWFNSVFRSDVIPTHWMPLPTPPRK